MTYQLENNDIMVVAEAKLAIGELAGDPAAYTVLGNACLKLNREAEAEEAFRAALNLDPDEAGHWHNLGNALSAQGKQKEAHRCYEQARLRGAPA